MSTNPLGAALTRYDAAVTAGAPQIASEQSNELTGFATAIERVEALLAAGGDPEPEGPDAIERIADIAFVLHERDVEASLCDALDAAVRELVNANAVKQANVHHVRQAAEMLRELSQRVTDMIALLQMSPPVTNDIAAKESLPEQDEPAPREQPASEDTFDGEMPREGLFPAELLEDDEFARAVAELAASLPALAEPVEAFAASLPVLAEPVEAAVIPTDEPADLAAAEQIAAPEPTEVVVVAPRGLASFAPTEPTETAEPDEVVVVATREPVSFAATEPTETAEADEAVVVATREPASLAATEPTEAPAPDRESPEARSEEAVGPAANEPDAVPELEGAVAETQHKSHLAADESVHALESEEPASVPPHGLAELPADESAHEQQPSAMDDAPAIEQTLAEGSAIVEMPDELLARQDAGFVPAAEELKDDAISNVTPAIEDISSETPSGEALPDDAEAPAQPAGSPRDSSDHSSVNGRTVVTLAQTDAPHIPSEALLSPDSETIPDSESARPADNSTITSPSTEPELRPSSEASSPPADVGTSAISAGQPSHQNLPRHNGEDLPAQIANELPSHDADGAVAATAAEVSEGPLRFAEASQALLPELALVDPQDDPGDLFEPLTGTAPSIATANLAEPRSASKISSGAAARQARSAAAADPLASMGSLSAEELLALFT